MDTTNEPVAWYKKNSNDYLIENIGQPSFQVQEFIDAGYIPLYTHPVNPKYDPETGEPLIDGYPLFSGLPHPAELTDEEIYQTWVEAKNTALNTRGSDFVEVIFARAILRKAREK